MAESQEKPTKQIPPLKSWPYQVRLLFAILWLIVGIVLLWLSRPVWYLLALALLIAYLLQPLVGALVYIKIPRVLATAIFVVLLIILSVLLPVVVLPALIADIAPISLDFNKLWSDTVLFIRRLPDTVPGIALFGFNVDFTILYDQIVEAVDSLGSEISIEMPTNLAEFVQQVVSSTTQVLGIATTLATSVIGSVLGAFFSIILFLLVMFYLTLDMPKLLERVVAVAPKEYQPEWRELWRRTGRAWSAFFRGQILLSLVVGTAIWSGLTIIGVPGALTLGIIAGILEVITNLGPILAMIPALALALIQGSTTYPEMSNLSIMLLTLALYVVVQQLENYILVPHILGGSVGVHPALVLVGVTVFTIQFGILGAFLATPTLATLKLWFEFSHARILGRAPYPELLDQAPEPDAQSPPIDATVDATEEEPTSPEQAEPDPAITKPPQPTDTNAGDLVVET